MTLPYDRISHKLGQYVIHVAFLLHPTYVVQVNVSELLTECSDVWLENN